MSKKYIFDDMCKDLLVEIFSPKVFFAIKINILANLGTRSRATCFNRNRGGGGGGISSKCKCFHN